MLRIIFLGTAGSFPTIQRSLPAIAIQKQNELFLFDCGEGCQRQLFTAKIGLRYKLRIILTHMHGDHVLGLPGLLQTLSLLNLTRPIEIYGPHGIYEFLMATIKILGFHLSFPIRINEITDGLIFEEKEYLLCSTWADHSVPNLAYALIEKQRPGKFFPDAARDLSIPEGPLWSQLQRGEKVILNDGRVIDPSEVLGPPRPGRRIVYSGDTRPCTSIERLAHKADLLIHEATFDDNLTEKANKNGHSTPSQAATIAQRAQVQHLILTHISSRYPIPTLLQQQAEQIFPNVKIAEDLLELHIPYTNMSVQR